jgi:hypothetical protein
MRSLNLDGKENAVDKENGTGAKAGKTLEVIPGSRPGSTSIVHTHQHQH